MLVKPDWDVFKAKFHSNPQEYFEWFSYLLFCREFDLDKGWHGYKDQPAVEKEPINVGSEVIGFQAKFYQAELSKKKSEIVKMLEDARRHYPHLTKIVLYTNQIWTLNYPEKVKNITQTEKDIEALALSLNIEIDWRTNESFFHSPFVCVTNNDLARYFFDDNDYKGWKRFGDWSSKSTDIEAKYYIDEDVKIISPNHNNLKSITVVEGLNEIRVKLAQPNSSIRLVGLSGVGKTRFAQALFDKRIGESALDIRNVWYCDLGDSPDPNPQHFIEQMIEEDKPTLVIVDNCGQELHSSLTKSIKDSEKISLLTIEYDVNDGLPEETSIYRMQPTTTELLKKVIERHYPELESININKIADFSGGNYRLALAIASNIDKSDNLSILTDDDLFKRLFYQKGELNEEAQNIGQIFSLVFSFNLEDSNEAKSELNILSNLAEVTPKKAYRRIEQLRSKDIVQKRGDFRAILPHALANNLAKQAISGVSKSELNQLLTDTPERFQTSFLKRLSYLHDNDKVKNLVKDWVAPEGYFGSKILDEQLTEIDLKNISLLTSICPDELLDVLKLRHEKDSDFLSTSNPNNYSLAKLLRNLAYFDRNFEKAFWLLFEIANTDISKSDGTFLSDRSSSLFHYYLSRTEATLVTKKRVIEKLYEVDEYHEYLLNIIDNGLGSQNRTVIIYDMDDSNGLIQTYGYQPKRYCEIWDWFEFLLNKSYLLDDKYPKQCRKILSNNIEDIIRTCGRNDEVIKYLKLFHDKRSYPSALLAIKELTTYRKEMFQKAPDKLAELIVLGDYLEPKKQDISGLISTYVLSSNSWTFKRISNINEGYGLGLGSFTSYEKLIEHIENNINKDVISRFLKDLLISNNSEVRQLGYSFINKYPDIDDFVTELNKIQSITEVKYNHFFLSGVARKLIESNWEDYQTLINYLLSDNDFLNVATQVIAQVSRTQEHYEFAIAKIIEHPKTDFTCLGFDLVFNRHHSNIDNETFENVLDKLIGISQDKIVNEILVKACLFDKGVNQKYHGKLLELLPTILNNKNYHDYMHALKFLLNHSQDSRQKVFAIVEHEISDTSLLINLYNRPVVDILITMVKSSTTDFMNLIYNNTIFEPMYYYEEFQNILTYADEVEILTWIDNDQDKIDFWFAYSSFYQIDEQGTIEWRNILHGLLSTSQNADASLAILIDQKIFQVMSWEGCLSKEMNRRLLIVESLNQFLKQYNHDDLIQLVEQKKADFQECINKVYENEVEESKRQQGFDW